MSLDDDRDDAYENGDDNGDDDDNGHDSGAVEQLEKAQNTLAELAVQLDVLHEMLAPTDAPPGPLATFLMSLETNASLRQAFLQHPDDTINAANLPQADKDALKSGGVDAINARLASEGPPGAVAWVRIWVRP
jgi:hypothetical protein